MTALRRGTVALIVLVGVGAMGLVCVRVAQRGRYTAEYSTYGSGPSGARALYLLARELGATPERLVEDISELPSDGMLVVLGGCRFGERALSAFERETIESFVEGGGTLLVAGARQFASSLETGATLRGGCPEPSWFEELMSGPSSEDAPEEPASESDALFDAPEDPLYFASAVDETVDGIGLVAFESPASIEVDDWSKAHVLMSIPPPEALDAAQGATDAPQSEPGEPAVVAVERGKGTVILLASAGPFQNDSLGWAAGGLLFMRLKERFAPEGPLLFDEYHLGVGQPRTITRYIRQIGGAPLIVQCIVVVLLFLWARGIRFGAPVGAAPTLPGGTASYVDAIAHLYRKSRDTLAVMEVLTRRALKRVAAHHGARETDAEPLAKKLDVRAMDGEARAVRRIGKLGSVAPGERWLPARVRALDAEVLRACAEREGHST